MNDDTSQNPPPVANTPAAPPPQQGARNRSWVWIVPVSFVAGCLPWLILLVLLIGAICTSSRGVVSERGKHIALIRVSGTITSGRGGVGVFSGSTTGSDDLIDQLERARKNKDVKAILLRIDSPGGSPAASEEIYNELMRIRQAKKPVYTSMADVAASGGYYIASASDKIYADESTLTGSIGVIWSFADMSELYKKIGFNPQVVKSGKFKDIGSSNRPLTPEEKALLEGIVMDTYDQFVRAVARGRNLPEADVRKIADGRVFTGSQAKKVKLVDEMGGIRETILAAGKAGGITGEPKVVEYKPKLSWLDVFTSESEAAAKLAITKRLVDQLTGSGMGLR